jgi:hypothetical protein
MQITVQSKRSGNNGGKSGIGVERVQLEVSIEKLMF